MSEDFGKELMMLGGTIEGFIATLLTVLEKILDFHHRIRTRKKTRKRPDHRPLFLQTPPRVILPAVV